MNSPVSVTISAFFENFFYHDSQFIIFIRLSHHVFLIIAAAFCHSYFNNCGSEYLSFAASITAAFSQFFSSVILMTGSFFTDLMFLLIHPLPFAVASLIPVARKCPEPMWILHES